MHPGVQVTAGEQENIEIRGQASTVWEKQAQSISKFGKLEQCDGGEGGDGRKECRKEGVNKEIIKIHV